ncbi:MAG: hypothetical protein ACYC3Q_15530 [Gemmatimonadaceae bacterium]
MAVSVGWVVLARTSPEGGAVESRVADASGGRLSAHSLRFRRFRSWRSLRLAGSYDAYT